MAELIYRTLRENIADIIRKRIIYQELEPGQKIVEQDLAKEFKTSRAPIREALRQLENEGLIEYVRNAGCSVKEITLEEMDNNPEMDSWIMKETRLNELIEDEKQKLLYVFDYMTERCFFIELSEIITGKDMNGAKCTKKSGDAPKQTVDFEEMAAASGSLDLDENFYGDQDFDMEDFDQEGFDIGGDASTPYEEEKF